MSEDTLLQEMTQEISTRYREIIEDWCKAYMAEFYQKYGRMPLPSEVTLNQQSTKDGWKFWFSPYEKELEGK